MCDEEWAWWAASRCCMGNSKSAAGKFARVSSLNLLE